MSETFVVVDNKEKEVVGKFSDQDAALGCVAKKSLSGDDVKLYKEVPVEVTAKVTSDGGNGESVPLTTSRVVAGTAPKKAVTVAKPKNPNGKRIKRKAEDLDSLKSEIAKCVKANPDCNVGTIAEKVNVPKKELALPIRQLLAEGILTSKGKARGVKYFPKK